MKKILAVAMIGALASAGFAADEIAREDSFSIGHAVINIDGLIKVELDRASATYRCGEEATFKVSVFTKEGSLAKDGKMTYRLDNYGAHIFTSGKVDLAKENPFIVKGTLPYPGFLRVCVNDASNRRLSRSYSAAFEPEKIRTAIPKPADFDSFWNDAVARLEKEVPLDVKVEKVERFSKKGITVSRVSFATFGGRVYGVMACPDDKSRKYPVRIACPGAGPGFVVDRPMGSRTAIYLNMSVHGFAVPDDDATRKALYEAQEAKYRKIHGKNSSRAYPVGGLTISREAAHYYSIILGINRAVSWVAQLPEVDKANIVYTGASQGGGFGLYLSALNPNITRAHIGVPALTDVMGCKADGRQSGWPRILEYETQTDAARLAMIEKNAPYFDGSYFAERIKIPVRLSVGYSDESCAPHAVLSAYNAIPSTDKRLYHGIGGLHGSPNAPRNEIEAFINVK